MKMTVKIAVIIGILLVTAGLTGGILAQDRDSDVDFDSPYTFNRGGMMFNDDSNSYRQGGMMFNDEYSSFEQGSMMYFTDPDMTAQSGEVLELEVLIEKVNEYISNFDEKLLIGDIFIYEDSAYYLTIMEEATGKGAMELLVNQYTGDIFPEYGPNMMWNLKYGMHQGTSRRMGGMWMHSGFESRIQGNYNETENNINSDEAQKIAEDYITGELGLSKDVSIEGHEFYGYYTFHIMNGDSGNGMLSVNELTGQVWFHNWHGELIEIIEYNN